jgi:hypothetical protein
LPPQFSSLIGGATTPVLCRRIAGSIGMKVFRAAVMAVFLTGLIGPAFAQDEHVQRYGEEDKEKGYGQIQDEKAAARAYKQSLGNIPDKAAPSDPWGGARGVSAAPAPKPEAKTAAKPSKKSTKTGNAAN